LSWTPKEGSEGTPLTVRLRVDEESVLQAGPIQIRVVVGKKAMGTSVDRPHLGSSEDWVLETTVPRLGVADYVVPVSGVDVVAPVHVQVLNESAGEVLETVYVGDFTYWN